MSGDGLRKKKNRVISTDGFGYGIIARAFKGERLIAVLGQFTLKECQAHQRRERHRYTGRGISTRVQRNRQYLDRQRDQAEGALWCESDDASVLIYPCN